MKCWYVCMQARSSWAEDDVPAKLKARVHKYLVDMGYFDDVEE